MVKGRSRTNFPCWICKVPCARLDDPTFDATQFPWERDEVYDLFDDIQALHAATEQEKRELKNSVIQAREGSK